MSPTIKELLDIHAISDMAIARWLGVHRNTISNWRYGRSSPSVKQYLFLLDHYKVQPPRRVFY